VSWAANFDLLRMTTDSVSEVIPLGRRGMFCLIEVV
jgi:hypothetical protein